MVHGIVSFPVAVVVAGNWTITGKTKLMRNGKSRIAARNYVPRTYFFICATIACNFVSSCFNLSAFCALGRNFKNVCKCWAAPA